MTTPKAAAELLEPAAELARAGRLYPSVILHGGSDVERRNGAVHLARLLLCDDEIERRPCGRCRHCRRIAVPDDDSNEMFHPDFAWLDRDLKTSTSAESTRDFLRAAQLSPYEARGQVFVVADAASLSAEASDALLKAIEEPGLKSPRNFFLLAPSRLDLAATLRSRSLAVYLGSGERPETKEVAKAAGALRAAVVRAAAAKPGGAGAFLLDAAAQLALGQEFEDPRAAAPWLFAASVAREAAVSEAEPKLGAAEARRLLALAEALLSAAPLRLRGISGERILEGLVVEHLAPGPPPGS